jgi:hypothetical protein
MEIARHLLDAGGDLNIRGDKFNSAALGWAHYFGRVDFAQIIHKKGCAQ